MKRLAIYGFIFLTALTAPVTAQEEIPTPEAFAQECIGEVVFYMNQLTETFVKLDAVETSEELEELDPQLFDDYGTAFARMEIKTKSCDATAEMLGVEYSEQLAQALDNPEVRLAMYKLSRTFEALQIKLEPYKSTEEEQPRLTSLREAYILAIKQKIERNWREPQGITEMPDCEVRVIQGPGGVILDVSFGACQGGSNTYRSSIENAVFKAEPLPKPGDPSLFERELIILFSPG